MGRARAVKALRGISGVLVGGMIALIVALVVTAVVAQQVGVPGPGIDTLIWHVVVAATAVALQVRADRTGAGWAPPAVIVLILGALAMLWLI